MNSVFLRLGLNRLSLMILFIGIAISVYLRAPFLNDPIGDRGEFSSSMTLIAAQNWAQQGGLSHYFCPLQTFPGGANQFIWNTGMRVMSESGWACFTSMPPFAAILPYSIFQALEIPLSPQNFRIFHLLGHLLTTLLIFFLVLELFSQEELGRELAALSASLTFLFLPANLWYFSQVFGWDTFWHYPWILTIFCALKLRSHPHSKFWLYSLAFASFLLVYSEFQGLICIAALCRAELYYRKSPRAPRPALVVMTISSILAFSLSIFQYSAVAGISPFFQALLHSGKSRSSLSLGIEGPQRIFENYSLAYAPWLLGFALLILVLIALSLDKKLRLKFTPTEKYLLFATLVPVLIHHLIFLNWTSHHFFSILKSSLAVAFLTAFFLIRICRRDESKFISGSVVAIYLLVITSLGSFVFLQKITWSPDISIFQRTGESIADQSRDFETIFAISEIDIPSPLIFYAGKNIQMVPNVESARAWLGQKGKSKAVIFTIASDLKLKLIQRIE